PPSPAADGAVTAPITSTTATTAITRTSVPARTASSIRSRDAPAELSTGSSSRSGPVEKLIRTVAAPGSVSGWNRNNSAVPRSAEQDPAARRHAGEPGQRVGVGPALASPPPLPPQLADRPDGGQQQEPGPRVREAG